MEIRKYRASDKEALITLWQAVFPNNAPHNDPAYMVDAKLAVDDLLFVAEESGVLVASCMAGYDGHRGWLYAVAVSPNQRGTGLGSEIVKQAVQALKAIGCIKVNLQIMPDNTQVAAFYESLGFAVEDRVSMSLFID